MYINEIDASQLGDWVNKGEPIRLVDVRTPAESARGTIPKSENMPLHLLPIHAEQMNKPEKIVFFCQSGARSAQACMFMHTRGHREVYNLRGGILSWAQTGGALS